MHRLLEVVRLHRRGHSARRIARLLRMGRDTIRAYLVALEAGGLLDGDQDELPELEVLRACVESQSPSKPAPPQQTSTLERWVEQRRPALCTTWARCAVQRLGVLLAQHAPLGRQRLTGELSPARWAGLLLCQKP